MNTVGQILMDARVNQGFTLTDLENVTKIKKEFISKIEENDWDNLPEFAVVSGFVKNIANALDLSVDNIVATLRRDYPPKKLRINPKPDVQNKFVWSPKMTFIAGVGVLVLFVLGYLGLEYRKFVTPPNLVINSPVENEVINQKKVKIIGKTTTDVVLTVNNQPVSLDQDGGFITEIEVTKETKSLVFKAVSRSGKMTEKRISINVE